MKSGIREIFIFFLIVFPVFMLSCSSAPDLSCPECNLIIINTELLRADFVGLLNDGLNATPNIDNFFSDGVIFEDVSAPAGSTFASINAIFRGQEALESPPDVFEFESFPENIPPTIAEVLSSNGWSTSYVDDGSRSGESVGMDIGFDYYVNNFDRKFLNTSITYVFDVLNYKKMNDLFLKKSNLKRNNLYLHYHINQLHFPYFFNLNELSLSDWNMSDIKIDLLPENKEIVSVDYLFDYPSNNNNHSEPLDDENGTYILWDLPWENISNRKKIYVNDAIKKNSYWYKKKLKKLDYDLKNLFDYLNKSGFIDNSIIILYANHGQSLGRNNLFHHGYLTQATIHVPLFIKHPNIHNQIRIRRPVSLVDLAQTIYDLFNIDHKTSGISLLPLISSGMYNRNVIYGENTASVYIRKGDWKLIDWGAYVTLANISADPQEVVDVSLLYPNITRDLHEELLAADIYFKQNLPK